MRKDRISVALTKDLIKRLNEASQEARRSRSDYVQIALESYLSTVAQESVEDYSVPRKYAPRPMARM